MNSISDEYLETIPAITFTMAILLGLVVAILQHVVQHSMSLFEIYRNAFFPCVVNVFLLEIASYPVVLWWLFDASTL